MELLGTVNVGDHVIHFEKVPLNEVLERKGFIGQKLKHPFVFEKKTVKKERVFWKSKKKIKKMVDENYVHYINKYTNEDVEIAMKDPEAIFEVKFDGGCGYLMYDDHEGKYIPYTRRDVRKVKNATEEYNQWKERKDTWIPCEPEPTVPEATHWPHMVPCYEERNNYKWMIQAFETLEATGLLNDCTKSFTVEWMGKKCNYCKTDPCEEDLVVVPHGSVRINVPMELRTFEGMKLLMTHVPFIEGLVCYSQHGVFKILHDLFWSQIDPEESKNHTWGTHITEFAERCPGFDFANGHGLAHYVKLTHSIQYIPKEMITPELYKKAVEEKK